ncbi:DUF2797 domain-containing protein, partial [Streptomyces muensis]|nr:DUF2797 domain-containing protein [Streptomyces muensis]
AGDGEGGVVVVDTRLMTGWELVPAAEGVGEVTVPVREFGERGAGVQDGLF